MDSRKKHDNPNPKLNANPLSKLCFWWMQSLFRHGLKNDLETKDLYNTLPEDNSEMLGDRLEQNWRLEQAEAKNDNRKPKLIRALKKTFIWSFAYWGGWTLFLAAFLKVLQPFVLGLLIWHFDPRADSTPAEAYMYASAVIVMSLLSAAIQHHSNFGQLRNGMRVRIACCSLIYRKILRLSRSSSGTTAGGQVINLLSNDVSRFDEVLLFLHYIWVMPIQAALITYLICSRISIACLAGIFLITIQTVPLQGYLGKLSSKLRMKIAIRTDERVRLMSEIIGGVQVIKMYAWEKPFEKLVSLARSYEIDVLTLTSYLRGFSSSTMIYTERTTLFITILAFVLLGNDISADMVFSLAQYFNILQLSMALLYPLAVTLLAEALVSVKRIENFLLLDENVPAIQQPPSSEEKVGLTLKNVIASWNEKSIANTLHDINVSLQPGKLCALVGPVGAGKSSFLQLVLGELQPSIGNVYVSGSVSFASQEPWLFSGSVRNNILFGQEYDKKKYREVTRVCALHKDFEQFPQGDKTLVGDRGSGLSGGQRARINLARAVYRDADVYLLDDPLSAVDTHVGKHLFDECINGYLSNKTRVLVTHQIQYLKDADVIVVLNNGRIEKQGTFLELQQSQTDFANLLESEDSEEKPEEAEFVVRKRLISEVSQISTVVDEEREEDEPKETEELMNKGAMSKSLFLQYFRAGASSWMLFLVAVVFLVSQLASNGNDYWVAYWTRQEEARVAAARLANLTFAGLTTPVTSRATTDNFQEAIHDLTPTQLPEVTGTIAGTLSTIASSIVATVTEALPTANQMSDDSTELPHVTKSTSYYFDTNTALYIYGGCITACVVLNTVRSFLFYKVCMRASKNLHNTMFENILQAPMRFFDTQPSGRILNRFSKDIGAVDEILPRVMLDSIQIFLVMTGILVQVLIINWWLVFPMLIMGFLYWKIRTIFLASAQDIKRLEGVTKSPVFSHVSASLAGLATIRSSGAQQMVRKEFDSHQDLHTSSYFLIISAGVAFGFWLDIVSICFVAFVTYSFIFMDDGTTFAGNVGLAISQALILCGMMQYGMRQTAETISQMTSVERVVQFTQLEKEGPFESDPNQKPSAQWPAKGQLRFDHAYMRYAESDPPVLKDLNILIKAGMKVGIVGRTGAGKSSLISALFRLAKLDGGIYLDEIDTKKVGLHDLRSKISIIPQEPKLFSATLRDNLDPFHKYDDASLWLALEEVELKDAVTSLDHQVNEGGSNFSAGQRQLLCLARAIVRNNRVLVLDEATANVDPATDALIQNTIRKKFKDCTVLTIAHRLNTVMDSDRVLVMDNGQMVEFDHPHLLLQNKSGYFTSMVQETGKAMTEQLMKVAKEAYDSVPQEIVPTHIGNGSAKVQ